MIDAPLLILVIATALASGMMGGAFYALSSFVMAGLERLPSAQGMAAMQSINVTAVMPGFMSGFFGTTVLSIAVAIWALTDRRGSVSVWLLVGAGLYIGGVFVMTAVYHVPRNNRLADTDPLADDARDAWARYLAEWTRWNHFRALSSLGAAAALTVAVSLG